MGDHIIYSPTWSTYSSQQSYKSRLFQVNFNTWRPYADGSAGNKKMYREDQAQLNLCLFLFCIPLTGPF